MDKKVLFTSRRPLGRCENITAIYNAYDGEKEFIQEENWGLPNPRIKSDEFAVMVADDSVSYSPGKLILVTHGASGGKSYGLKQPNPYHSEGRASLIDYVVSTSEYTVSLEAKQHGVSDYKVLPLGMPRMDYYDGKEKGDGGTELAKKRAYLFAPTLRKRFEPKAIEIDWDYIDGQLTDDEIMAVKRHMVTKEPILKKQYKHIIEIDPNLPSANYLIDADVVITDYSSILFDAHVLGKPVVLFDKDRDCEFATVRGMSFNYPYGYASRYARDENCLVSMIKDADAPREEDTDCLMRSCGACDGHATERVVDLIKSCLEEEKTKERKKRVAVYTGSRNLYPDMIPAIKSMLKNGKPDLVYLLIEDNKFPYWLPSNVKIINVSKQTFFPKNSPNMKSKFTYLAMMRAALAKVLPDDIDTVLSLDCDTLVVGDITELWERDLDGYYFSASLEPGRTDYEKMIYTNTGVALYNLKMLRETGKVDEVIEELNTNQYPWVEQDVFNFLCQGGILQMPSMYNANDYTVPTKDIRIKHYAGIRNWKSKTDVMFYRLMYWWKITDEVEE